MDEIDLINRLQNKEEIAFKELVANFKNSIANLSYKFLYNSDDAEDITQEVFIEVFNSIGKFNRKSSIKSWIYRITVSKSIDKIRKNNRKKRINSIISIFGKEFKDYRNKITDFSNPEKEMESSENLNNLISIINKLPENQKIALTLSKINDLSQKETAEIMDTTEGAVEALLFRAKKNLKILLEKA